MTQSVMSAAYGLLKNLTKAEVEELIEVLSFFNSTCNEDDRAGCLLAGCEKTSPPQIVKKAVTEGRAAGSMNIYLSGTQPVCQCCKR